MHQMTLVFSLAGSWTSGIQSMEPKSDPTVE